MGDWKTIITIGREYGAGGRTVAKLLSDRLGIPHYDKEIITLAAEKSGLPEQTIRGPEQGSGKTLLSWFLPRGPMSAYDQAILAQANIIRKLAEEGPCIIVGRCADLVLTGQDVDCLSLFICAPFEWRVHHRMELDNLDEKAARALVEKTDAQREKYYTHYTGRPWGLPENYDICINSARLGIDRTAALLAEHCRELFSNPC